MNGDEQDKRIAELESELTAAIKGEEDVKRELYELEKEMDNVVDVLEQIVKLASKIV